ncbi:MAG: acetoin utilization protein AcuC [Ardenticatenales bacterium]|nr:acetoin utilization protein AcuC [Ardenticatenales bacterium]
MRQPLAFIYHERYGGRGTAHHRLAESWKRYQAIRELSIELGLNVRFYRQAVASDAELRRVHPQSYIDWVRQMDLRAEGFLDKSDTPAYRGVFHRAAVAVGGTLLGVQLIADGLTRIAFNPGGGLHHARATATSGFCVFNDLAVAVRWLMAERGIQRPVIIDVDGHHGDGTQEIFYREPILTVSLHQYDGRFYPGSGALEESGEGEGVGYALNIPLPRRTGTVPYLRALDEVVLPVVRAYNPDFVLLQFGVDAHWKDRLVSLRLTAQDYGAMMERFITLAHSTAAQGRLMIAGGGGYTPDAVVRSWGVALATSTGEPERAHALHDELTLAKAGDPTREAEAHALIERAKALHLPRWSGQMA